MTRQQLTATDVEIPPFPMRFAPYLQMRVHDLTPNEYWATAEEDLITARMVQAAWRAGVEDAHESHQATGGS